MNNFTWGSSSGTPGEIPSIVPWRLTRSSFGTSEMKKSAKKLFPASKKFGPQQVSLANLVAIQFDGISHHTRSSSPESSVHGLPHLSGSVDCHPHQIQKLILWPNPTSKIALMTSSMRSQVTGSHHATQTRVRIHKLQYKIQQVERHTVASAQLMPILLPSRIHQLHNLLGHPR